MLRTDVYVACLDLSGRRAVVVGEGAMAEEKVDGLRACAADVDVIRPDAYDESVLEGAFLVIGVTDDLELAERIFDDAERRAMLVNIADVPRLCNFILPAITRRGPLTIAVSTSGASPALAKRVRREVDGIVTDEHARLAHLLDELRPWAKEQLRGYDARKAFFEEIVDGDPDPVELLRAGNEAAVRALIDAAKRRAVSSR